MQKEDVPMQAVSSELIAGEDKTTVVLLLQSQLPISPQMLIAALRSFADQVETKIASNRIVKPSRLIT